MAAGNRRAAPLDAQKVAQLLAASLPTAAASVLVHALMSLESRTCFRITRGGRDFALELNGA